MGYYDNLIRQEKTHLEMATVIPSRTFEEYAPRYAETFKLKMSEDGIVEARMHTKDRSVNWDYPIHRAIQQLAIDVGCDTNAEVFIFGGYGNNFVADQKPVSKNDFDVNWVHYEHQYYDGCRNVEVFTNYLEIPTIGVINGPGFHTEMALFCDITLIADDANIMDVHYVKGNSPGDGIQIAMRECMGIKRANYAMLTGEVITPQKALEYGMVNEIVPKDKIYDRAQELAKELLKNSRVQRRMTVQQLRYPWKEMIAKELRGGFAHEMMGCMLSGYTHGGQKQLDLMKNLGCDMVYMEGRENPYHVELKEDEE